MKEARQRYESRLVEVDSGRKQEYEFKLTEGLAEMRAQNEEQLRLYRGSMDATYQTKVRGGPSAGPSPPSRLRDAQLRPQSRGRASKTSYPSRRSPTCRLASL